MVHTPFFNTRCACTTLRGSSPAFWRGKKIVENFLYVKKTVELVPEHPHRTHRVNPSSITSKSSVGTVVMFPLLKKSRTLCEPKLLGASYHPDEGVCQFGSQILVMSLSSGALLDHIADFLKFISSTQSYWFSLNTSYDHGCHLSSCFRLDLDEYQALLIVAGLASYTRFGFQIKATAWRKFLGGRRFVIKDCPIEFKQKKIDLDAYINGTPPSGLN